MLSLDQLKMFVAAADAGSFSGAGRVLNKGQSAVSTAIANLEIDLGFDLFDRATRKPALTKGGERMLTYARAVLMQIEDLNAAAGSILSGDELLVRIVLDDAILLPALGRILIEFGRKFPATQVEVLSAVSPEIPAMIADGSAEIGLMFSGGKVQKGLEQVFIGNLPFVSVSIPDYPLAKLETIGASDLMPYRQLLLRSSRGNTLDQFPALSTQILYATSFHVIRELVLQGTGWAYLPEHLATGPMASGRLAKLQLRFERRHWSPPVECVTPKHNRTGPAHLWLTEMVKDILP